MDASERVTQQTDEPDLGRAPHRAGSLPPPALRRLQAVAGVLAPVGFTVSVVAQSLARDDHHLLHDPASALAAGPEGWIQNLTFAVAGGLILAFGLGLHLTIQPPRHFDPGPQLLGLFGLGLVGAALWPAVDASGAVDESRLPHLVAGLVTFTSAWLAALVLATRLRRDPEWRPLARYARAAGVALLLLFVAGAALVRPAGAPLHDWLGLFQWTYLGVWFPFLVALAIRLFPRGSR